MKTSNKLLIGFSGVLVILMLFSAIILRINVSKGITNMENFDRNKPDPNYKKEKLQPFKTLVLTDAPLIEKSAEKGNRPDLSALSINKGEEYALESYNNTRYRQSGDTLYVEVSGVHSITLLCPSIENIDNNSRYNIFLSDVNTKNLQIHSGSNVSTSFNNSNITSLTYTGEKYNTLQIYDNNKLDSVRITLQKGSSLFFYASYNFADMQVDSLHDMSLSGQAVSSLKQIK